MRLKDHFDWGTRTYVMGVLNITPDSFSGDGLGGDAGDTAAKAVQQARVFVNAGADILDIGGESTRPGSEPLSAESERARVVPVIEAMRAALPETPISVDTYRAAVAGPALDAGANIVNDVWGLRADPELGSLVAAKGAPVVLMHNRSDPGHVEIDGRLGGQYTAPHYDDFLGEIAADVSALAEEARVAGIDAEQIILDPGLAFGKGVDQNLALINNLDRLKSLGFPLLVGPSRKSFIGRILDLSVEERVEGTAAAVAIAIARGADIVRVHDVKEMVRVARMSDAILRASPDPA